MTTQALVQIGRSLSENQKRMRIVIDADALITRQCANSLEIGLASQIDACIMYVLPFLVHRITWDAWPLPQLQYAACPPTSWGHCKRDCSPTGEGKKNSWDVFAASGETLHVDEGRFFLLPSLVDFSAGRSGEMSATLFPGRLDRARISHWAKSWHICTPSKISS